MGEGIKKINKMFAHKRSPLKWGGIFHVGVEVGGMEWAFGYSDIESLPGISCVLPGTNPQHRFRETLIQGLTSFSPEEVADLISEFIEEWPGDDYDLLRRNCCHFADEFCQRLGVGRIPRWIHRFARIGARADGLLRAAQSIGSCLPVGRKEPEDESQRHAPVFGF